MAMNAFNTVNAQQDDEWSKAASSFAAPQTAPQQPSTPAEKAPASTWNTPAPSAAPGAQSGAAPTMGTTAQNVIESLGVAATPPAAPPTQTPAPSAYTPLLQRMRDADPTTKAATQDELARTVAANLQAAGHTVEWDGATMMVDGRPYTVNDGSTAPVPTAPALAPTTSPIGGGAVVDPWANELRSGDTTVPVNGLVGGDDTQPVGTEPTPSYDPTLPPPPDDWPQEWKDLYYQTGGTGGINPPWLSGTGAPTTTGGGATTGTGGASSWTPDRIRTTNYGYMEGVDASKMRDPNVTTPKYIASRILASGGSLQEAAAAIGATVTGQYTMRLATGEEVDTMRDDDGVRQLQWLVLGGGSGGAGGGYGPGSGAGGGGWGGYTPGQFPGSDPRIEGLADWLAHNPMSMGPNVVAQMKAASDEEQMQAAASADEAAKRFGFQSGYISSPWLASERAATARGYDQGIIQNRRNIDIEAARTNTADMRASISTLTGLWAQKKDVFALNEQLKLEAARLGMSYEQFLMNLALQYDELNERAAENYWGGQ